MAAIFSFSALTTLFMVSCTSSGGSISLSSVRRISMPQLAVSILSVVRSSSLMRAALAVGRLERQGADDVAQRGARQVDDLVLVVGDVVLRGLDVSLRRP